MKRKSDEMVGGAEEQDAQKQSKKLLKESVQEDVQKDFRPNLFANDVLEAYTADYAQSKPYKHAVIRQLMADDLLRKVRTEIRENVHFTPKETDIYKIHQSGDLANLDGLDDKALAKLPSLLNLRDALYSPAFRKYVATITNSGELSGRKTDMAINVYTPGCHLLCHDDVIGSRRVSYILYLTDPDILWQEEWGGSLRLYPATAVTGDDGETAKIPSPEFSKVIPPAWNQLSFFAVQPGESFHDVEEVYHASDTAQQKKEGGRVRMAISGWYHIPQIGEEGYIEGAEEKLAQKSSLVQLQGKADQHDLPQDVITGIETKEADSKTADLDVADIDFLLKYMSPTYLTPNTLSQVALHFSEQSSITLDELLSKKFSARLRKYIEEQESTPLSTSTAEIERNGWKVARPPHKHRFIFLQDTNMRGESLKTSPIVELLHVFLPSREFRKWLQLATQCEIESHSMMARRFRKGLDYALATSHEGEPRLELSLGLTPTKGWGADDEDEDEGDGGDVTQSINGNETKETDKTKVNGKAETVSTEEEEVGAEEEEEEEEERGEEGEEEGEGRKKDDEDDDDVGGHEVYMAGDDEIDGDAAIYKASAATENDNVLFAVPASWNKLSIVLRDNGVLKFVKYVSKAAKGDRWDITATFGVKEEEDGEEEGETETSQPQAESTQISLEDSDVGEFNGFPASDDSDSD